MTWKLSDVLTIDLSDGNMIKARRDWKDLFHSLKNLPAQPTFEDFAKFCEGKGEIATREKFEEVLKLENGEAV